MAACNHCGKPATREIYRDRRKYCAKHATMQLAEAWQSLGISESTFYRMVAAKRISLIHITARTVLVPRADVDAIKAGQR